MYSRFCFNKPHFTSTPSVFTPLWKPGCSSTIALATSSLPAPHPHSAGADDVQCALLLSHSVGVQLRPAPPPGSAGHANFSAAALVSSLTVHTSLGVRRFRAIHPGFYAKNHKNTVWISLSGSKDHEHY